MKKFLLLALASATMSMAYAGSALDLNSRAILRSARMSSSLTTTPNLKQLKSRIGMPQTHISGLMKVADGVTNESLEKEGVKVYGRRGNIVMVSMPTDEVERIADLKSVKRLELSRELTPMMDVARAEVGVDKIHSGDGLPKAYTGKGVVTGIVDGGMDPHHINFKHPDGTTRVEYLMHMYIDSSNPQGYSIDEYLPDDLDQFITDDIYQYHGTHTMGIMAGGYRGEVNGARITSESPLTVELYKGNNPYYGAAYESDIVASCGELMDMFIAYGCEGILNYSYYNQKPAVINLSLGSMVGPHDVNSVMNQYLSLAGKEAIICVSAGNEGDMPLVLSKDFTAESTTVKTFIKTNANGELYAEKYPNFRYGKVHIYGQDASVFTVKVVVYNKKRGTETFNLPIAENMNGEAIYYATEGYVQDGDKSHANFSKAFNGYVGAGSLIDEETGRYEVIIDYFMSDNQTYNADGNYVLGFIIEGADGQKIDAYCDGSFTEFSNFDIAGWDSGTTDGTISDMACANNILTVGAYNTVNIFGALDGTASGFPGMYPAGEVSSFSSYGTLRDGRNLPHICAPGTSIVSSVSTPYFTYNEDVTADDSYFQAKFNDGSRDNYWFYMYGTSMSCPLVAGSIALWLEADPDLTIDEVKDIVATTAIRDEDVTGYTGNPVKWGAGKFDAYSGLKEVLRRQGSVKDIDADNRMLIKTTGDNRYNIFLAGSQQLSIKVCDITGRIVKNFSISGDETTLDLSGMTSGIYVVNVNGCHSQRIIVK